MTETGTPEKGPYTMQVEPGRYAWCACGRSAKQPYCDGAHRGSGMTPVFEEITERRWVAWCGCRRSGGAPYCDGSHSRS